MWLRDKILLIAIAALMICGCILVYRFAVGPIPPNVAATNIATRARYYPPLPPIPKKFMISHEVEELLKNNPVDSQIAAADCTDLMASHRDFWEPLVGKRVAVQGVVLDRKGGTTIGTEYGTIHVPDCIKYNRKLICVVGIVEKGYGLGFYDDVAWQKELELQRKERELRHKQEIQAPVPPATLPRAKAFAEAQEIYHRTDFDGDAVLEYVDGIACPPGVDVKTANTYYQLVSTKVLYLIDRNE